MKISTLKERIEKAQDKISKKEGTIQKKLKSIEKKSTYLKTVHGIEDWKSYNKRDRSDKTEEIFSDIYWTICDLEGYEDDIIRLNHQIEETKKTIQKYEGQLAGEIEKESIFLKEIPDCMKQLQKELVQEWDRSDMERQQFYMKKIKELGYSEFVRTYSHTAYDLIYKDEKQIHSSNEQDAKIFILDLYNRVKDITGEVTDWSYISLTQGNTFPVLTGWVEGKEGKAKVESILAGGYNIQRLHIRTLVHSI